MVEHSFEGEMKKKSNLELINQYSKIVKELKARTIIRSKNITGDIGENIAVEYYKKNSKLPNLKLVPAGTQHIDAESSNKKYAIKTITGKTTGVFYGLPSFGSKKRLKRIFDYLIIVKLNENYEVSNIYEMDWLAFLKFKKWHRTMQAWNITLNEKVILKCKKIY